jgi:hypothetical protein
VLVASACMPAISSEWFLIHHNFYVPGKRNPCPFSGISVEIPIS